MYQRSFSYGTVIQLCVARNRRRISAKLYHGIAQVTSRRAHKGFEMKLNPDRHWSAAFYGNLNILQYTDGCDILNINRDDQAGFRLDTMTTHHQYTTPVVRRKETMTTHTDYVNRYPSVIQTTCYNFSVTKTSTELCAGVTKAQPIFQKCPVQHAADINMLSKREELRKHLSIIKLELRSESIAYVWMVRETKVLHTLKFNFTGLNGTTTGRRLQLLFQLAIPERVT